jgi:hypothetical protein
MIGCVQYVFQWLKYVLMETLADLFLLFLLYDREEVQICADDSNSLKLHLLRN